MSDDKDFSDYMYGVLTQNYTDKLVKMEKADWNSNTFKGRNVVIIIAIKCDEDLVRIVNCLSNRAGTRLLMFMPREYVNSGATVKFMPDIGQYLASYLIYPCYDKEVTNIVRRMLTYPPSWM